MKGVWFKAVPFDKKLVTLALESGVDAIIAEPKDKASIEALGRITVLTPDEVETVCLSAKADEERATSCLKLGKTVILSDGWEIIPVENILAQADGLGVEVSSLEQARLAAGVLERGVDFVVVLPQAAKDLKAVVKALKLSMGSVELKKATVTKVAPVGMGHRVCVDTISVFKTGQGMLVGNSSAFTFLVNAETESNPYVAARPFRINAGGPHAYVKMPRDKTAYLDELGAGREVLIVSADGSTEVAVVGRVKVEIRPMLLIEAEVDGKKGAVFLQNAETIRLVGADGKPISVVSLQEGDAILVALDEAGRHFGMRIKEEIKEA